MKHFFNFNSLPAFIILLSSLAIPALNAADLANLVKPERPAIFRNFSSILVSAANSVPAKLFSFFAENRFMQKWYCNFSQQQATVLPAVFARHKPDSKRIRLLTANLILFPGFIQKNSQDRIEKFIRLAKLESPDLICLQEIWDNSAMTSIIRSFPDYASIFKPGLVYNQSGLLILSRLPVKSASSITFLPSLRHNLQEMLAMKGILSAVIKVCDTDLILNTTHLYSSAPSAQYRPGLKQFEQLMEKAGQEDFPAVIAGDLNLQPEELKKLLLPGMQTENCPEPTAGLPERKKKLDYILVHSRAKTLLKISGKRLDSADKFSDHSPVIAEIEIIPQD